MSKPIYASFKSGFSKDKPDCWRCGECCMIIPVEIRQDEIDLISKRLKPSERLLFLNSITQDFEEANVLPDQWSELISGEGWMKAPCIFLEWEERHGKKRAHCRIYKIRPRECRIFFCGRDNPDEHLNPYKYVFRLDSNQIEVAERILAKGKE